MCECVYEKGERSYASKLFCQLTAKQKLFEEKKEDWHSHANLDFIPLSSEEHFI